MTNDISTTTARGPASRAGSTRMAKRAAIASYLGGMLEYFDFFIYATAAALVFNTVFFPDIEGAGTLAALATFGVAYVARPFGAVILGHFGDKIGRKNVLIAALVMMGTSTFLIGCLPDYGAIGIWAPVLLVLLRLLQGVSAGGETAGASSLTIEHAPASKRGFFGSWTMNGIASGFILASLVFIPVAAMDDEQLFSWGWRIPFWSSAVVLLVAYFVRRTLEEPEVFKETVEQQEVTKLPIARLFQDHWRDLLRLTLMALFTMVNTMVAVFGLAYATQTVGLDRTLMLWVAIVANIGALFTQTLSGYLSDRFGRRPIFIIGCLGCAVFIFFYFSAISTSSPALIFLTGFVLTAIFYSMPNGIYPAFFTEMFNVRVRYTGMAVGLQIGLLVAGFTPAIASAMVGGDSANWMPVAILTAIVCTISAAAAFFTPETFRIPLQDLGTKRQERGADGASSPTAATPAPLSTVSGEGRQ